MDKNYRTASSEARSKLLQPTIASTNRAKPVNLQTKVNKLNQQLNELKVNFKHEQENIMKHNEQEYSQKFENYDKNLQSMKEAISTLADAVTEEVYTIRQ